MESLPYILLYWHVRFCSQRCDGGRQQQPDLFGVLVLSFAAANTGGITRDLLIGAVPPGAIKDWHYLGAGSSARAVRAADLCRARAVRPR